MTADTCFLRDVIRDVPDFPEPGVTFKDITPLLARVDCFRFTIDALADHFSGLGIDMVAGIDARGFIIAAPVAYRLGAGFVPVRKPGKLPSDRLTEHYDLEYGTDAVELHTGSFDSGSRVLVIDDVLATGGTAAATIALLVRAGAEIAGLGFLCEIESLAGRGRLGGHDVTALVSYP
ncbi:MAG: adenine phosphoribosyltransferase [Acidimicrobiia bacterium]|nr:adenine phosphoribosyltransferase [Acidimicrobiia bacterium]